MIYGLPHGLTPPLEGTCAPHLVHTSGVTDGFFAQRPPIINQIPLPLTDEEIQNEYEIQKYQRAAPVVNIVATHDSEAIQMCQTLVKKMRVVEGHNLTHLSALEMCMVPDVVLPPKFKLSEFEKYRGLSCRNIHLKVYCRNMGVYAREGKLMIHYF